MRVLLWAAIIFLVVMWLMKGKKSGSQEPKKHTQASADGTEAMVRCAHCGVYVPASEILTNSAGAQFCSEEHLRLHRSE